MRLILTGILFIFTASCITSPLGRRQLRILPNSQMERLGRDAFEEMKAKHQVLKDVQVQNYVECIVRNLLNSIEGSDYSDWEVKIFEDPTANAFALPGGRIGVHKGIFKVAQTTDQLASVLGHEIGHVISEHGNERVSQALAVQGVFVLTDAILDIKGPQRDLLFAALGLGAQVGYLLPYNRIQEKEADLIGLQLMAGSGFNPEASIQLWKNMYEQAKSRVPEFLSTHPSHEMRIQLLQENLPAANAIYKKAGNIPSCGPHPRLQDL